MEIILTPSEKKKIRPAVEWELEQYRMAMDVHILEGESQYFNKETLDKMKVFCNRVEDAVNELPDIEKQLSTKKYLRNECDYITDIQMYTKLMDPPIYAGIYSKYRTRAMFKLAFLLDVNCGVDLQSVIMLENNQKQN